jgi:hypothetical protein
MMAVAQKLVAEIGQAAAAQTPTQPAAMDATGMASTPVFGCRLWFGAVACAMPEPWGVEGVINPVQRRADGHAGPTQPHFYVRQALAVSDLSKRHGKELVLTREVMNPVVAVVAVGTSAKLFAMNPVHDLTENRFFGAHSSSLALPVLQTNSKLSRNRHTAFIAQAAHIPTFSVNATRCHEIIESRVNSRK